ncbi:TetR/AcrR family transcriptional regulator [Yinghuangia sp. YIM S10712]|uniref:TetR/AcrR family transcriptional regulator n=1 Tax=Yinghuangia sp. YIM S10712 TaxID=3436930 RepID=UPI003F53AED8
MTAPIEQPPGETAGETAGSAASESRASWAERTTDRSRTGQRSRGTQQLQAIRRAARRLIGEKGTAFTTAELTKESGVALQTVYRHFAGKDQVILAVVEEVIAEEAVRVEAEARRLANPVARLRLYITGTLSSLRRGADLTGPQFITTEHWRLYQLFPEDMARAAQPFGDLIERELRAAVAEGLLASRDPARDAWVAMKLVTTTYHHYAFATAHDSVEEIAEQLWAFCLAGFGGDPTNDPSQAVAPPGSRDSETKEVAGNE